MTEQEIKQEISNALKNSGRTCNEDNWHEVMAAECMAVLKRLKISVKPNDDHDIQRDLQMAKDITTEELRDEWKNLNYQGNTVEDILATIIIWMMSFKDGVKIISARK